MVSTLILWFVYAVFLKIAIGIATDVDRSTNTLGRAFLTAAVLSLGQGALATVSGTLVALWPIVWLFIIKHSYGIGWFRSIVVWLALVLIGIGLALVLFIPLGLMAATSSAFVLIP